MGRCQFCYKEFTLRKNLYRHIRNIHTCEPEFLKDNRKGTLICPKCGELHVLYKDLRNHLMAKHDIEITTETITFTTKEAFLRWKQNKEREMKCFYKKTTGTKSDRSYYVCHRSYVKIDSRYKPLIQSKKLSFTCPSTMQLTKEREEFKVSLYLPHIGHKCSLKHINLTLEERNQIASKIAEGVSFQNILDHVRDNVDTEETLSRMHRLERQDLRNITKEFSLNSPIQDHKSDAVSLSVWVEMMKELGSESPVLYFKPQGQKDDSGTFAEDDFVLVLMTSLQKSMLCQFGMEKICVDATHDPDSYNFLLSSIVVIDEWGRGIPVAFLLSNKIDILFLTHFFNIIKNKTGIIKTKVFMSDDAPGFRNSWTTVMGPPDNMLICAWHVDRNWRKNLYKVKGAQTTKSMVYKYMRVLLETQNIDEFQELLKFVCDKLESTKETTEFGQYFKTYYAGKPQLWAYCYRIGLGIHTNMYIESMHETLEYIYLEGKRVDKCIYSLMKLVRDHMFKRMNKIIKGNNTYRINLIQQKHKKVTEFQVNDIHQVNDMVWRIRAASDNNIEYIVQKINNSHVSSECELFCSACHVCIHDFCCSCPDSSIHLNICEHIHAVVHFNLHNKFDHKSEKIEESNNLLIENNVEHNGDKNMHEDKNKGLKWKLDQLYALITHTEVSHDVSQKLEKHLDNCIDLVNPSSNTKEDISAVEPFNKNIKKLIEFESSKEKSKAVKIFLTVPDKSGKQIIRTSIIRDIIVQHDHHY